jgi:hypothetical protein
MPALTETSKTPISVGSLRGELASFSAINNADYWDSGLGSVKAAIPVNGAAGVTLGVTFSGSRITFASSGALANVTLLVLGSG